MATNNVSLFADMKSPLNDLHKRESKSWSEAVLCINTDISDTCYSWYIWHLL